MDSKASYQQDFHRGNLDRLIALSSEEAHQAGVLALAVWSHSLAGQLEQGLWHINWIEQRRISLSADDEAIVHFALGVAYTRLSKYAKARDHFAKLKRLARRSERAEFFLFQGLGFYRFFCGHYRRSSQYALRAFERSTQLRFVFGQLLAEELMAHGLIEQGRVRRGLFHLRNALDKARKLDHQLIAKSYRLNFLLYRARYTYDSDMIETIQSALARLHPQDSYSRNSLMLQLANQFVLRGRVRTAYEVLDSASETIYASRNRRQIALLNFSLAFLTWLRGGRDQSLHLLRSAELHLHRDVDHAILAKMRGLRARILGQNSLMNEGRTNQLGLHSRILARQNTNTRSTKNFGDDKIGDLMDRIRNKDPEALKEAIQNNLFYLLYDYYDLRFDQKALLFDVLPKGAIVIDQGDIWLIKNGLNRTTRRLLECLASSHQTKEALIRQVWNYVYEPERHDTLIYSAISKLRATLGAAANWIESDETGYRLRSGIKLHTRQPAESSTSSINNIDIISPHLKERLSFRQLRILSQFDNSESTALGVDDVVTTFGVSRATATRDLSDLHDRGYVHRLGRARATRYLRTNKGREN